MGRKVVSYIKGVEQKWRTLKMLSKSLSVIESDPQKSLIGIYWEKPKMRRELEREGQAEVADLKKSCRSKDIKPWDKRMLLFQTRCRLSGGNAGVGEGRLWGDIDAM